MEDIIGRHMGGSEIAHGKGQKYVLALPGSRGDTALKKRMGKNLSARDPGWDRVNGLGQTKWKGGKRGMANRAWLSFT